MRLLYSPLSPYARKVRVLIRERGALDLFVEEIVNPLETGETLRRVNPLGKIPVLLSSSEAPLFDSPLIIEYLDAVLPGEHLLPSEGENRWRVLRQQALADGIMDAALAMTFEKMRVDAAPSAFWMVRWREAVSRGVLELENRSEELHPLPDIGSIAIACALGYLDLRCEQLHWRKHAPVLAGWYAKAAERQSMRDTTPP